MSGAPVAPSLLPGPCPCHAGGWGQVSASAVAQCVQTKQRFVSCVGSVRGPAQMGLYSSVVTYFFL